jgi:hypothetical protein
VSVLLVAYLAIMSCLVVAARAMGRILTGGDYFCY